VKTPLLDVQNAAFSYGENITIFDDISFSLKKGDVFCVLGPNGIGKSTLIRCLARLLPLTSGRVLLDGHDISRMNRQALARKIGFIPQIHTPAFSYSVFDFVLMGRSPYVILFSLPAEKDITIAEEALSTVGITALRDKIYTHISGGEQQLVLFARVLAQEPRLLLLDEPTSHLDLGNQLKILGTIRELSRKGLTILMATHFPDHAFLISGRVGVMLEKGIPLIGPAEDVITEMTMKKAYNAAVRIMTMEGDGGRRICIPRLS